MSDKYILDGHTPVPVDDLIEWAKFFEGNRHVASDMVGNVRISTVFLGLDHSYGSGPPLLFESMIFGGSLDREQRRYSTWDQAERGHAELLTLVRQTLQ